MGLEILLILIIAVAGMIVQSRLQRVFAKYSKVMFHGGLTGREVAEKMLRDHGIRDVQQQRGGSGSSGPRVRTRRTARGGLRLPEDALGPCAHRTVLLNVRPDSDYPGTDYDECLSFPVLDRHCDVLHDLPLQCHHPAGGVQCLGPRPRLA